ncbi:hypothetical protein [Nocardia brasiliensis]|uniref:Uncharacterized protein n=1 Tax=Nocardia brasiliensis (strain ATCC 700358 / HUJEG-1) TaxID=1133849 RepID=K0EZ87_NOCB7|nr:hypothetical protein [Nocardia brasiliensis]AFU02802.1 hypothetical protein O3I_024235 [Nocardia brasiliensis ATCC 700358]OCF84549.1 hypothetical protein AW168_40845 [Nocardia brasiliensis]
MDSIDLWFRVSEVRPIAEHAVASTEHAQSLSQQLDNEPAQPSLMWAKDDGCYLMSNGEPQQLTDPDNPASGMKSAYAAGWGSGTRALLGQTLVGSNDFEEHLPLHEKLGGGATLIERIRAYEEADGWLVITVTTDSNQISFSSHPPAKNSLQRRSHTSPNPLRPSERS